MVGQGHPAAAALCHIAAVPAHDGAGRPALVDKQDRLLARGQRRPQRIIESPAENGAVARAQFGPQIDDLSRMVGGYLDANVPAAEAEEK